MMAEDGAPIAVWEPYRPSNGTEGEMFMERWCFNCARDAAYRNNKPEHGCQILARTFVFDISDAEYPKEWIRAANDTEWPGTARCMAFVPTEELSLRARRAWITRRRKKRETCADLLEQERDKADGGR
jgi:hypothetical protein